MSSATRRPFLPTCLLLAILAIGCVALPAGPAFAQGTIGPPGVDHYLVYRVINPPSLSVPVALSDQFMLNASYVTLTMDYFMTPVNKNGEGIIDPVTHYTWWRISTHPFGASALVTNQFGQGQHLDVFKPGYLLNPAVKNAPAGATIPPKNHFKAYDAKGLPPARVVDLVDQFFPLQAYVDSARYLATPAQKLYNGVMFPILDPIGHLVVYKIVPQPGAPPVQGPVFVADEFGRWPVELGERVMLCVPSFKYEVTPVKPKNWGDLKHLYR
jgi:hypothetical protein